MPRIGALLLDRILRRHHHEVVAQCVVTSVDRYLALVHRLQQGGLSLGRCAVDLVGEQQLGEDWSLGQYEAVGLEIEKVGPQHVARHQVGCELDAAEFDGQ